MKLTSVQTLDYVGMTATLPLADGVTTLTGANAAGKTLLTSAVPGILFAEAQLKSGATVGITFENDKDEGSMFVSRTGNKSIWRGTINGDSKEHNTIKPARAWLAEHLPVSQSVFSNVNYLAAFRSGTMLAGSPAARMQLLSDIVGLRVFEELRKGVAELSKSAHVTLAMRERINSELNALAGFERGPKLYLSGVANYIAERRSNLKAKAITLADMLDDRPYGNIETSDLEKLLALAPKRNKAWDDWEECKKLNIYDIKKPSKADYATATAVVDILEIDDRAVEVLHGHYDMLTDPDKERDALSKVKAELANIDRQLEHLEGHNGKTCPTCGNAINSKLLRKTLRTARKALIVAKDKQEERVWVAKIGSAITKIVKDKNTTIKDVRVMLAFNYNELIESYEAAKAIEARFGGELPFKPDKPRIDIAELTAELKLRKRGFGKLADSERQYELLSRRFQGATGVLAAVTELTEEEAEFSSNHRRLKSLQRELRELPNAEDAELLINLLKALDNRNARNRYLELVATHLIDRLNELAPAFFPYKMEFAWTNGKLIANRKGGATDVVLLSGREGRTFMLMNAVAIQHCLPPAKRLRTLFLDELEAGSSPENRALLAELIPTLLDHYSNIVVVTPLSKSEFYIDGPRYKVVEQKGKKTLRREE